MLFPDPSLGAAERAVLEQIDEVRDSLKLRLHDPRRWFGSLRRVQFARAVQGSNSIEGINASLDDTAAIDLGEEPLNADEETRLAIKGYRDAMTYVMQMAAEPNLAYDERLLKSLHFMMTSYDMRNRPGQWRLGEIFVRNDDSGVIVYEGPDIDEVPALIDELAVSLNAASDLPPIVRAAMAHLNLVMVHPFRDGNGRMARCLQTLILAREGTLNPVFCSIEEYLGRNTQAYYDVLAEVGGGRWEARGDARPFVRFTLTAHLRQARTVQRRIRESERLWGELETLAAEHRLPERTLGAMYDAALGLRVRNATYRGGTDEPMSDGIVTRDLRALTAAGLLEAHGEKRGRYYTATAQLRALQQDIVRARDPRDDADPFAG